MRFAARFCTAILLLAAPFPLLAEPIVSSPRIISPRVLEQPAELKALMERAEKDPSLMHDVGTSYYHANNIAEARRLWDLAASRDANLPAADVQIVHVLLDKGMVDAAAAALRRAEERRPNDPNVAVAAGDVYLRQGKVAEAEAAFKQAVEKGPRLISSNLALGSFYEATGRYEEAEALYTLGTELAPGRHDGWTLLARLKYAQGRPEESLEALQRAERVDPGRLAEARLGELYFRGGDRIGANHWYKQALSRDADNEEYLVRLGQIESLLELGDGGRARFEKVLASGKESPPALLALAITESQQRNFPAAEELYRRLLKAEPESLVAMSNLAKTLYQQGKSLDEAHRLIEAAWKVQPESRVMLGTYGCVLAAQAADDDHAEEALTLAVQGVPDDPWTRFALGQVLLRQGKRERAIMQLEGCLILDPSFPKSAEVKQLLKSTNHVSQR